MRQASHVLPLSCRQLLSSVIGQHPFQSFGHDDVSRNLPGGDALGPVGEIVHLLHGLKKGSRVDTLEKCYTHAETRNSR